MVADNFEMSGIITWVESPTKKFTTLTHHLTTYVLQCDLHPQQTTNPTKMYVDRLSILKFRVLVRPRIRTKSPSGERPRGLTYESVVTIHGTGYTLRNGLLT